MPWWPSGVGRCCSTSIGMNSWLAFEPAWRHKLTLYKDVATNKKIVFKIRKRIVKYDPKWNQKTEEKCVFKGTAHAARRLVSVDAGLPDWLNDWLNAWLTDRPTYWKLIDSLSLTLSSVIVTIFIYLFIYLFIFQVVAENNFGRGPAGEKTFKIPKDGSSADFNYNIFLVNILVITFDYTRSPIIGTIKYENESPLHR